jgi:hypothetical protein
VLELLRGYPTGPASGSGIGIDNPGSGFHRFGLRDSRYRAGAVWSGYERFTVSACRRGTEVPNRLLTGRF